MSERSEYRPGEFCWVDLATSDVEAAASFYGQLLEWDHESADAGEETGGYGFFNFKGKQVAGVGPIQGPGQPPAWSSYVSVTDADETASKITDAGGSLLMDPMELPNGSGRMAICQDAEGAFFSIIALKAHTGAQLVNEVGSWTWNQLASRDLDTARRFYGAVFGWTLEAVEEAPSDSPYFMWQVEGQEWEEGLGGAMTLTDEAGPEVPPHWQVYFAVGDADGAIETTRSGGGTVLFGPETIPVGKLAAMSDPQGASFAIIEPDYPEQR